jgi:N-acetylglucosamine kinase-like BadF-type ATPase
MAAQYYIGLEGGGTKTSLSLARASAPEDYEGEMQEISHTQVGGSNHNSVGKEEACREVQKGINELLQAASIQPEQGKTE